MSHTYKAHGAVFIYNSDLSGDVIIERGGGEASLTIPGMALLDFVAQYVRRERTAALEAMSDREVLGLS